MSSNPSTEKNATGGGLASSIRLVNSTSPDSIFKKQLKLKTILKLKQSTSKEILISVTFYFESTGLGTNKQNSSHVQK